MIWMIPLAIAGLGLAALASSSDSSSSSSSRRETYTETEENVIYEPDIETKEDYIDEVKQELEAILYYKYGAVVKFDEHGGYKIITYGDKYRELEKMEVEYQNKLYELENLEIELKYL